MSRPRRIPWEPVRTASPRRADESIEDHVRRCRETRQASIDEQKARYYNKVPTPSDSEDGDDSDSSSSGPFELTSDHVGLRWDNPNLIYYGIQPRPLINAPPPPDLYPPFWWRRWGISDDDPRLSRSNFPAPETTEAPDVTTAETAITIDPATQPTQPHAGRHKRAREDDDQAQEEREGRAVKQRRIQDDTHRDQSVANRPTVGKRTCEPNDEHGNDSGKRATPATASFPLSDGSPSTQNSGNSADRSGRNPSDRKRSREPEDDRVDNAKRRRITRATPQSPALSNGIRPAQSNSSVSMSPGAKRPRVSDEDERPAELKRRRITKAVQRRSDTPAQQLSPISPPLAAAAPATTRRQTRSTKPAVLLELDRHGKPSEQIPQSPRIATMPRNVPTPRTAHAVALEEEDLDKVRKEPKLKPDPPRKAPRQRNSTSSGVQKKRAPRGKSRK